MQQPQADRRQLVVISGAGSGIGKHSAQLLAEHGYTVIAGVRSDTQRDELQQLHPRIRPTICDVTSSADLAELSKLVHETSRSGLPLAAVVSNAGMAATWSDQSCEGTAISALTKITTVDYIGAAGFVQAVLPTVRADKSRVILNTAMMARIVIPFNGGYAAAKAALTAWGLSLRRELQPYGIPVSFLEFAGFATPLTAATDQPAAPNPAYPGQAVISAQTKTLADWAAAGKPSVDPQRAAETVLAAVTARKPKRRYNAGGGARALRLLSMLPEGAQDRLLAFALDRAAKSNKIGPGVT